MLQVNYIRQNVDLVKERLAAKYYSDVEAVDRIVSLDEQVRRLKVDSESLQAELNSASKEIGALMGQGRKEEAEQKKRAVSDGKASIQNLTEQLAVLEKTLYNELIQLPNLPHVSVPVGTKPEDNVTVREGGIKPDLPATAVPHWELIKKYDLVDFETGAKITGSGFPLFKGKGAKLQRAMIQYFLDYNIAAGYTEYLPPFMVNETSAYGTGQLPDKEGQMYFIPSENFYMIPTAEVPLTNIYRDEILKENDLPVKMTAYTPCFRREAGSFGKDVRGLNRVHQFDKVEIVQLVHPAKSYEVLEEMVAHIEKLLDTLNLPYRILK